MTLLSAHPILPATLSFLALVNGALLSGCQQPGPEAAMEEYLQRLGRSVDVEPPSIRVRQLPRPPRTGELRLPLPSAGLDALDFLTLTGCRVQVTIGKRNSSLGRMAAPSQRLLLDLEYLRLAPECIAHQRAEDRADLATTLERAWQAKRDALPAAIFNATLAGPEYRQLWRLSVRPGTYPAATGSQAISALRAINGMARRWLSGDYRADNLEFEIFLGEVATGDGGKLLRALAQQQAWLGAADSLLEQRERRGPLCGPGIRHRAVEILPTVVRRFFVGQVQPHSVALGRRYHQLLPPIRELEAMLADTLPAGFESWRRERDDLLGIFIGAPRQHVQALQGIMAPCGGMGAGA